MDGDKEASLEVPPMMVGALGSGSGFVCRIFCARVRKRTNIRDTSEVSQVPSRTIPLPSVVKDLRWDATSVLKGSNKLGSC